MLTKQHFSKMLPSMVVNGLYCVYLSLQLDNGLALADLTHIVHWLLKGGNSTLNYHIIQFLHKLGEWQCT